MIRVPEGPLGRPQESIAGSLGLLAGVLVWVRARECGSGESGLCVRSGAACKLWAAANPVFRGDKVVRPVTSNTSGQWVGGGGSHSFAPAERSTCKAGSERWSEFRVARRARPPEGRRSRAQPDLSRSGGSATVQRRAHWGVKCVNACRPPRGHGAAKRARRNTRCACTGPDGGQSERRADGVPGPALPAGPAPLAGPAGNMPGAATHSPAWMPDRSRRRFRSV